MLCAGPVQFPILSFDCTAFVDVATISIDCSTGGVQADFDLLLYIPHSDLLRRNIDRLQASMQE